MGNRLAPVAIFAFNRPGHLKSLLDSLSNNCEIKSTDVYVFIDGPRGNADTDLIVQTKKIAHEYSQFRIKKIVVRDWNLGLGNAIKQGINEVLAENDSIVVLEDDLVVTKHFLKYMNRALDRYKFELKVASIHGYCFDFANPIPEPFFLRGADCLGWATWKDRWDSIEWNPAHLLKLIESQNLIFDFNLNNAHSYSSALSGEVRKGFHSWAIYWHASMYAQNRLTLFPGVSLVEYKGADGSGTHTVENSDFWKTEISKKSDWIFPDQISESIHGRQELIGYYNRIFPPLPLLGRIKRRIKFELKRRLRLI